MKAMRCACASLANTSRPSWMKRPSPWACYKKIDTTACVRMTTAQKIAHLEETLAAHKALGYHWQILDAGCPGDKLCAG